MRAYKGSRSLLYVGTGAMAVGAVFLASSCGGGSSGGSSAPPAATAATIDTAGVTSAINDFGGVVGICKPVTSNALRSEHKLTVAQALRSAMQATAQPPRAFTKTRLALGSTPPADSLGDCGGRSGYRNYSHVSGVTTATLAFEGYCTVDSSTGEKQTIDGSIAFVNTATPTASGPITTQMSADTSKALTLVVKSSSGAAVSSQTMSFTAFKMAVGVPGGTPTASNPNVMSMGEMSVTDNDTGKTYRETDYLLRQYETPSGNTEMTFSGRGYRSGGTYFDIVTTKPIVESSNGDLLSGTITFTGANGSNAVATLVPGPEMQATLLVNGVLVTSVPTCRTTP